MSKRERESECSRAQSLCVPNFPPPSPYYEEGMIQRDGSSSNPHPPPLASQNNCRCSLKMIVVMVLFCFVCFVLFFLRIINSISTKTECDYLYGWLKNRPHAQKSHQKVVNPRDIAGNAEEEEEEYN